MNKLKEARSGAGEGAATVVSRLAKLAPINAEMLLKEEAAALGVPVRELRQAVKTRRKETGGGKARQPAPAATGAGEAPDGAATEDWLALELARERGAMCRFDHTTGQWLVWDAHRWRRNGNGLVLDWIRELVRRHAAEAGPRGRERLERAGTMRGVEALAQTDRAFAVEEKDLDQDPLLLGTPGGVVDLRDGSLRPGRPGDMISLSTAVTPAPEGTPCPPRWQAFLEFACAADQDKGALMAFLQVACGYALTGLTREQKLFFWFGDGGNGKGVFTTIIREMMGEYATTAPMDMFIASYGEKHPTELTILHKRRLVVASETEEGRRWNESRIKTLTGEDEITARRMREDNWSFKPTHKLWFLGNHKPALHSVDQAARRRFKIIPFDQKPEVEDPDLLDKLREELPAILRWGIDGAVQWQAEGFPKADRVDAATADYLDAQDLLGQWLEDKCLRNPLPLGPPAQVIRWWTEARPDQPKIYGELIGILHKAWSAYLEAAGERPWSSKRLSLELEKRGYLHWKNAAGRYRLGLKLVDL